MSSTKRPKRVKFLLCDDVRGEQSGKITLVGLYPDDRIYVHVQPNVTQQFAAPAPVAVLNQLAVVCLVFGGDGALATSAVISGPGSQPIPPMDLGSPIFKPGSVATIGLQGGLFRVDQFGKYTCTLTIHGATFSYDFEILAGPAPWMAAAPAAALAAPVRPTKKPRKKPSAKKLKS